MITVDLAEGVPVHIEQEVTAVTVIQQDLGTVEIIGALGPSGPPGQGVPSGGTTGEVLIKASDNDYDTDWSDDLATVAYVNARTPQVTVGSTEPISPEIGDVWVDTS